VKYRAEELGVLLVRLINFGISLRECQSTDIYHLNSSYSLTTPSRLPHTKSCSSQACAFQTILYCPPDFNLLRRSPYSQSTGQEGLRYVIHRQTLPFFSFFFDLSLSWEDLNSWSSNFRPLRPVVILLRRSFVRSLSEKGQEEYGNDGLCQLRFGDLMSRIFLAISAKLRSSNRGTASSSPSSHMCLTRAPRRIERHSNEQPAAPVRRSLLTSPSNLNTILSASSLRALSRAIAIL